MSEAHRESDTQKEPTYNQRNPPKKARRAASLTIYGVSCEKQKQKSLVLFGVRGTCDDAQQRSYMQVLTIFSFCEIKAW